MRVYDRRLYFYIEYSYTQPRRSDYYILGSPVQSISVPFESDSRILATSSVHISILCNNTAEDLATAQVRYVEAYILGNKAIL